MEYSKNKTGLLVGMLYRAVTPLYIVRQKNKELYFYSDDELKEWKKTATGKADIIRAKG